SSMAECPSMPAHRRTARTDRVKVSVIGTGSLGKEHVRIYSELAKAGEVELAGVFDLAPEISQALARRYGVRAFASIAEAAQASDAFSVVTPTQTHFELTKSLLDSGKHVLVEKPMTDDAEQAAQLIELAHRRGSILQVGHV